MSKSYKKFHVVKDHNKGQKQLANRKIRRTNKLDPLKGGDYKKMYPTWDICDYCWVWTKEDAIAEWYEEEGEHYTKPGEIRKRGDRRSYPWRHNRFGTLEKWLEYWEKCVRRK